MSAAIHAKFFPPARPVCRYSRTDLERMAIESASAKRAAAARKRDNERKKASRLGLIARPARSMATGDDARILRAVAMEFGITVDDLVGTGRTRSLTDARCVAADRLIELGCRAAHVARLLNRNPSSISRRNKKCL